MADNRTHLVHPDLPGSSFDCPTAAVPEWKKLGWIPGDRPPEVNPVAMEQVLPTAAPVEEAPASKSGENAGTSAKGSD